MGGEEEDRKNLLEVMVFPGDVAHIYYIAKSIQSPIQIIKFRCSNHWCIQVYKFKNLGMQTVSTNICERMVRSQELSEF